MKWGKRYRTERMQTALGYGVLALILAALALLTVGCKSGKGMGGSSHQQSDSTSTEIRWRYIHILDTVPIFIPVEKQKSVGEDSSHLETDFATSDAFVDSLGRLHHTLENRARQIDVPISGGALVSDTNHYESHAKVDSIYIPQPYPVEVEKPLSKLHKFIFFSGLSALLAVFAWLTVRIIRFFRKK